MIVKKLGHCKVDTTNRVIRLGVSDRHINEMYDKFIRRFRISRNKGE